MNIAQIKLIKKIESLDKLRDIDIEKIKCNNNISKKNSRVDIEVKSRIDYFGDFDSILDYIKKNIDIKPKAYQIEPHEVSLWYNIDKNHAVGLRVFDN